MNFSKIFLELKIWKTREKLTSTKDFNQRYEIQKNQSLSHMRKKLQQQNVWKKAITTVKNLNFFPWI